MSQFIEKLLLAKFPPPAYACLPQCRNATGFDKRTRTADCVVMSLYPSRGLHLYGFEIKEHRGDWLSEMRNPAKAESIAQYCHEWWLVTGSEMICKPEELPQPWGHITVKDGKLKTLSQPTFNKEAKNPDYYFLGAILRNAMGRTPLQIELDEARRVGMDEGLKNGIAQGQGHNYKQLYETHEGLVRQLKEFEDASGLELRYGWKHAKIGEAVKRILACENQGETLDKMADQAEQIAKEIRKIRKPTR